MGVIIGFFIGVALMCCVQINRIDKYEINQKETRDEMQALKYIIEKEIDVKVKNINKNYNKRLYRRFESC